ncbi:hypothetical protein U9M48_005236 [Paspalum notatum var. saurae]|uniref:ARM repeat superfamily protein n=1 Tax=Paspalum notatum var. saurae TaxID=547442 RepID=A0AAQ3PV39_PASNO
MGRQSTDTTVDSDSDSEYDSEWPEVELINSFSVFMGYLLMAVRGLSFLVLTWTTVVLLGGYVSALSKKDFWFLTVITLVQTAGVFNASLTQKLNYIWYCINVFGGLMNITLDKVSARIDELTAAHPQDDTPCAQLSVLGYFVVSIIQGLAAFAAAMLQLLIFAIILCPLAFLYVFGIFISAGLSLARLIQRDYGDQANEGHLKSALLVLYSLAVLQGAVFSYRYLMRGGRRRLVNQVAKLYGLEEDNKLARASVWKYLVETKAGCENDPSFIKERNLIAYAVELMQSSNCPSKFFSGISILGSTLIKRDDVTLQGQQTLIKQLIGSPSSSHLLLKLLHTLDPKKTAWQHDKQATRRDDSGPPRRRDPAEPVPGDDSHLKDDDSSDAASSTQLMEQGLLILGGLATDEDNCKIISSTHGLLSKVMMPTSSDLLHRVDHANKWTDMVNMSLSVTSQLAAAPGDIGKELRSKIANDKEAIASMEAMLECSECGKNRKSIILVIKILKQLGNDSSSSTESTERTGSFLKRLSDIFTAAGMDISIRKSAAEALLVSLQSSTRNATVILEANDNVINVLTETLLDVNNDSSYRLIAAQILEHLSVHYPKEDGHLKETMIDVMLKVFREILRCESTEKAAQTETEVDEHNHLVTLKTQKIPQDSAQNTSSSNRQQDDVQNEDRNLLAALLSLCVVVCDTFISVDQDLAQKLGEIASSGSPFTFSWKLKEMVERHNQPTGNCLTIMKHTCKMIMSMMKHNGRYDAQDMESLMKSLSDASTRMLDAEGLMIMASSDHCTQKPTNATLANLVKEAQELLRKR